MLTQRPYATTVYARENSVLFRVPLADFQQLVTWHPQLMSKIVRAAERDIQRVQSGEILSDLFGRLDPRTLRSIESKLVWQQVTKGDAVFNEGDRGNAMYVVVNGRIRLTVEGADGRRHSVRDVERGEIFGEAAVLTDGPRTESAIALKDTDVVKLPQSVFDLFIRDSPVAMM